MCLKSQVFTSILRGPPQMGPGGILATRKCPSPFFVFSVPKMVEKHTSKIEEAKISKKDAFLAMFTILQVRNKFLKQDVSNNMHLWSIHWVIFLVFECSHFDVC